MYSHNFRYENEYKKYEDRVSELEKMKDNIAKDTLEALSGLFTGSGRGQRFDDDEDDEVIEKVGRGHKNRKKYKPAIEAK